MSWKIIATWVIIAVISQIVVAIILGQFRERA